MKLCMPVMLLGMCALVSDVAICAESAPGAAKPSPDVATIVDSLDLEGSLRESFAGVELLLTLKLSRCRCNGTER